MCLLCNTEGHLKTLAVAGIVTWKLVLFTDWPSEWTVGKITTRNTGRLHLVLHILLVPAGEKWNRDMCLVVSGNIATGANLVTFTLCLKAIISHSFMHLNPSYTVQQHGRVRLSQLPNLSACTHWRAEVDAHSRWRNCARTQGSPTVQSARGLSSRHFEPFMHTAILQILLEETAHNL